MNIRAKTKITRTRDFSPQLTWNDYPQSLINNMIKVICPPLSAQVDMNQFIRLLLASYSLSLTEKFQVIDALPTLSQFQCDSLLEVWNDETEEFQSLARTEWPTVMHLCAIAWINANMLATYCYAGYDEVEENQALQTMLMAKYDTPAKRAWIQRGLVGNHAMTWQVFGSVLTHTHAHKTVARRSKQSAWSDAAFESPTVVLPNEFYTHETTRFRH